MDKLEDKIQQWFSGYPSRYYKKGKVLLFPGDSAGYVFYLVSGSVKQYGISKRGDEVVLNLFKPGAFFPMANVINDIPAKYMLEVETDAEIRLAPAGGTIQLLQDNPDILFDLLARVYRGTEGLLGRLEHLMAGGAGDRFIYELLTEAKRFGKTSASGEIVVSINESGLGQRAGLTRETVNREIRKLKAKDLISVKRNTITIPDIAALERLLGQG